MKIKILKPVVIDGSVENPGTILETRDDMAQLVIALGSAESAEYLAPVELVDAVEEKGPKARKKEAPKAYQE